MKIFKNALMLSHEIIKDIIKSGDMVIDATCGNGHDTCFLAELVGDNGLVYGFDVQDCAIKETLNKLKTQNFSERVKLINDRHENMDLYVENKVKAVMFNLGYLPGGDHTISTQPESTILAINKSMKLLDEGGVITLVIYHGQDSGFDEKNKVLEYVKSINQTKYTVLKFEFINQKSYPPMLVVIQCP